jgi:hypothetical protein
MQEDSFFKRERREKKKEEKAATCDLLAKNLLRSNIERSQALPSPNLISQHSLHHLKTS